MKATNLDALDNAATIMQTCQVSKSSDHANPAIAVRAPRRVDVTTIPVQRRCRGQQTFSHPYRIHLCNMNHDILMHNNKFVKESTPISLETRASVDSP
jgi:hypothetical protein